MIAQVGEIYTPFVGVKVIGEYSSKGCHGCYFESSLGESIEDCVGCSTYKCYIFNVIFKEIK